jgi:hypothetical protein
MNGHNFQELYDKWKHLEKEDTAKYVFCKFVEGVFA